MKVKDLISTHEQTSDNLLYYCVEMSGYDIVFTANSIHHVAEEAPFIFEKEVKEWHFTEQIDPYTTTQDADTLYITIKE